MCINKILFEAAGLDARIAMLKRKSSYFPNIYYHEDQLEKNFKSIYASTLIRVYHNDKWYTVHSVSSMVIGDDPVQEMKDLLEQVMRNAHIISHLHIPMFLDDLDPNQIDEVDRLKQQIDPTHGR